MMNKKKKSGKSLTKKIVGWLHLWLGLVSGLVVFVVALTGTLFVFCDEIIDFVGGDAKYVQVAPASAQKLSPDTLLLNFKEQVDGITPFYFDTYADPNRTFRVASMTTDRKSFAYTYINPYTGKVIKTTQSYWFFYIVAHIHSELLLHDVGKNLVGIATIIFYIQLIGGLILWWPKKWTKSTRKVAFTVKKGTKWRRKNYDFHNVFGFYALIPALLITVTGLIMSYEILMTLTQRTFGGSEEAGMKAIKKYEPKFDSDKKAVSFESIVKNNTEIYHPKQIRISFWANDSATTYFAQQGEYLGLKSRINGSMFLVNKYTGEPIAVPQEIKKHFDINDTNFNLHVGYWGGMFGKILTFIVGLICTSLPITGFLIWYGRKYKSKKSSLKTRTT